LRVEILYFEGCPNYRAARALVERVAAERGLFPHLTLVKVGSPEDAVRLCFLGSPTIRVDGHDVEPGADDREGFMLACRVYRSKSGFSGLPDEAWVRDALRPTRAL
jgi:hypothetical protein